MKAVGSSLRTGQTRGTTVPCEGQTETPSRFRSTQTGAAATQHYGLVVV